jgi:protein-S-isoprenylcysteine O-methyltransferase Ste14
MPEASGVKGLGNFLANFPIPEPIIGGLLLGLGLQRLVPVPFLPKSRLVRRLGGGMVVLGTALIAWSVWRARRMRIAEPERLLTGGPYGLSRNPMYVGWLGVSTGVGLRRHSLWVLLMTWVAFLYLHLKEIPAEEDALEEAFSEAYRAYRARVRRYL